MQTTEVSHADTITNPIVPLHQMLIKALNINSALSNIAHVESLPTSQDRLNQRNSTGVLYKYIYKYINKFNV